MKIDYRSRGLCVRLLLLLVIGLGLPILAVNVAHAQDQAGSTDGTGTLVAQAPADKQAAQTDTTAMAEGSAAGGDFEFDPWEPFNEKMFWFNREVLDRLCAETRRHSMGFCSS